MVGQPSGTVTFLFTDIEGSTRLWQDQPEAMKVALECHDELLRSAIEANSGYVFKTVGDAFCAAFQSPLDAVRSVVDIQSGLKAAKWPPKATIRVRAAIHSGEAQLRDGDYFGVSLSRVGRLLSAGHGGQVLLSGATRELVRDSLPSTISLRTMGTHRLRDLSSPDEVFQLEHPDLGNDFPALKTLDNRPNNLPRQRTSFIGRDLELLDLEELSRKAALLTLTGAGGTGKTRLAVEFAAEQVGRFKDGLWFVDLAPIVDPDLVPNAVADVFRCRQVEGRTITQVLAAHLADKSALVVIDNCEHLLEAAAALIDELLNACPGLRIVATSRESLGVPGEQLYRTRSLATPKLGSGIEALAECDSVRLFGERAQLVRHDFRISEDNADAVASICSHLDGIPLAIELAAARIRSMSAQDVCDRLDQKFRLLTSGSKTGLKRQQTLQGLIDWSYDLLNEREQALLQRLSVFRGGWTAALAEQVCCDDLVDEFDVLDLLSSLVDKSLLLVEGESGHTRYRMLETVRDYAADKLAGAGADEWRDRHLQAMAAFVEPIRPYLTSPDQADWLRKLEAEHDNVRTALAWAESTAARAETGLKLIGSVRHYWRHGGHFREGYERSVAMLGKAEGEPLVRGRALLTLASMATTLADFAVTTESLVRAIDLSRQIGDRRLESAALRSLGSLKSNLGDFEGGIECQRTALEASRAVGDDMGVAVALGLLGSAEGHLGHFDEAEKLLREAITMSRSTGDPDAEIYQMNELGSLLRRGGRREEAVSVFQEGLKLAENGRFPRMTAWLTRNLCVTLLGLGRIAEIRPRLFSALQFAVGTGASRLVMELLEVLAPLLCAEGRFADSAKAYGKCDSIRSEIGYELHQDAQAHRSITEAKARETLGDEAYEDAYRQGQAMTMEEAASMGAFDEEAEPPVVDGRRG